MHDYEQVFGNSSVPVSCCNKTNSLDNTTMITCEDIVVNVTNSLTQDAIYSEVHNCINKCLVLHYASVGRAMEVY